MGYFSARKTHSAACIINSLALYGPSVPLLEHMATHKCASEAQYTGYQFGGLSIRALATRGHFILFHLILDGSLDVGRHAQVVPVGWVQQHHGFALEVESGGQKPGMRLLFVRFGIYYSYTLIECLPQQRRDPDSL